MTLPVRGHAIDKHIRHQRRVHEYGFHQGGVDEIPIASHAAANPVVEVKPAILILVAQVTHMKPAVANLIC